MVESVSNLMREWLGPRSVLKPTAEPSQLLKPVLLYYYLGLFQHSLPDSYMRLMTGACWAQYSP